MHRVAPFLIVGTGMLAASCSGCPGTAITHDGGNPFNFANDSGSDQDDMDANAALDAGPADSGSEVTDAGEMDSGAVDLGPIDSGFVDAGQIDAGSEDAGPMDAGQIDAGTPDAGGMDAGGIDGGPVCSSKTQFIYVVSADNTLSRFFPPTLNFQTVGTINCGGSIIGGSPYSMAVDRVANIWSVFTDGTLKQIDPTTAACTPTNFAVGQSGFTTFGMGFSANMPGGTDETLYVSNSSSEQLAFINTSTLQLHLIGTYSGLTGTNLTGRAELTGTGNAELFGAFEGDPFDVAQINRLNADIVSNASQAPVTNGSGGSNFAFAAWGGVFYLFQGPGSSTNVYEYDPVAGTTTMVTSTTMEIVGAGVSTCAPSQ